MQAVRSIVTAFGLLATSSVMAQTPGVEAPKSVRTQAEELGKAASERFGEVLKEKAGEPGAKGRQVAQAPKGGEDPWTPALRWLTYSSREYQDLLRRLSEGGGAGPARPTPPADAPKAKPPASGPAVASRKAEPAPPDGGGWLTSSSERFQALMRRLSAGAAPPEQEASAASKSVERGPGKDARPAGPMPAPSSTPADKGKSFEEERKLAEARRAETSKREAEVKKTEDALKAEKEKKAAETRVAEAGKRAAEARKAEENKRLAEAKQADERVGRRKSVRRMPTGG